MATAKNTVPKMKVWVVTDNQNGSEPPCVGVYRTKKEANAGALEFCANFGIPCDTVSDLNGCGVWIESFDI